MGILDRFTNPVWHEAAKLPKHQQVIVAALINSHGYLREAAGENLVDVLLFNSRIPPHKRLVIGDKQSWASQNKEFFVDEAVVGMLRSCKRPLRDLSGKLSDRIASAMPDLIATFALSDANNRSQRSAPNILDDTDYSTDPDEAREQVLLKWRDMLGITNPTFVRNANNLGFAEAWDKFSETFFDGWLIGMGRVSDDEIINRARKDAAIMPLHLKPIAMYATKRIKESV